MAQYKLIQDIEAEDKILGPLTLRQFIFAMVAAFLLYICFILVVKHAAVLLAVFLPPALFCAFFAFPFGRDQPTEVWFLAKLRFWFKPRKRLWNQSGVKELVTITVPKKVEKVLTKGFSQTEVRSRLQALAATLDSRGWAIKNISTGYAPRVASTDSDRLIGLNNFSQEVPADDLVPADDILDETSNPIAQQFDTMIDRSARDYRQRLIDQMNEVRKNEAAKQSGQYWFVSKGQAAAPAGAAVSGPVPAAGAEPDEPDLSARLAARTNSRQVSFGNLRTVKPLSSRPAPAAPPPPAAPAADDHSSAVTAGNDPAILSLAKNNDLNVATLARQARKNKGDESPPNEVVISLH